MLQKEDPYMARKRNPTTDQDIIYAQRRSDEGYHRFLLERRVFTLPLILPSLPRLPYVELFDVQDCCNKATAIYWADYRQKQACNPTYFTMLIKALNVIYPQWFLVDGHHTDIEYGRFVAKFIRLQDAEIRQQTVAGVLKVHQELCERVITPDPPIETIEYQHWTRYSKFYFNIDIKNRIYYRLRPLFQALVIYVEDIEHRCHELPVKLIRTGFTDSLSAPIDFNDIKSGILSQNEDGTIVTVLLQTAIKFVMALDERERKALPRKIDEEGQEVMRVRRLSIMRERIKTPYNGPELTGPPSSWVDTSKFETVVVPFSHNSEVHARIMRGELPGTHPETY
ncbi:uncharacterized protein LY89DRAFT_737115 [Mollisia scopiformis]|uniref:Uncharacterized protein n=1 Tax=Mollisia scopiformis TaxID=149040 RepID=A0A194X1P6_MOLSC|nr:uncharacterized protein LY89DRAFT_737115 [Mollisia scopiformis]KUJ14120.1 hypothetical protein LY89DRAFT_737115 [Mollisia scopiformis]